jgi:Domain of unknown function (DUF1707)
MVAFGPSTGSMLAASADRDRAVDVLRAAFTEGRLTQAEFSERVARVQASRTYSQLAQLVGDLPIGPHVPALIPGAGQRNGTQNGPDQLGPAQPGSAQPGSAQPGSAAAEINDRPVPTPLAHLALTALVVFTLAALFTALIVYMHILGQPTNVQLSPGLTQLPHAQLMPAVHALPHQPHGPALPGASPVNRP